MDKLFWTLVSLFLLLLSCNTGTIKDSVGKDSKACEYCADSTDFDPVSKEWKAKIKPEIENYYHKYFDSLGFNGSFLVAKNGQILFERYLGYSNVESNELIRPNTPMHLASVSKVLTASAIFRLVEKRRLELNTTVASILPVFPYKSVTIRMLLNHRSGVPKYANFTEPDSVWGVEKTLYNKDILNTLAKHNIPSDFEPDTKFVYNNSNFALLALVIEKMMNTTFKKAMHALVFEPLGMTNTFVFMLEKDFNRVSQSYSTKLKRQKFDNLDAVYGDKNIYSTPRDMLKFDLALQKNEFISDDLKKEIFKGYSYERPGINNYGLGIRIKEWDSGQKLFFHNGWWHGNRTSYVTLKKEGVTLIAMTNANARKVYSIYRLAALFGDYPFVLEEEGEDIIPNENHSDTLVDIKFDNIKID